MGSFREVGEYKPLKMVLLGHLVANLRKDE